MRAINTNKVWLFMIVTLVVGFNSAIRANTVELTQLVKDTVIYGSITKNTPVYDDWGSGRSRIGELNHGQEVEIVQDRSYEWYFVRDGNGNAGWVSVDSLWIPGDPATNDQWLRNGLLEDYVNMQGLSSKTDQLVWVDLDRQLTHVFVGKQGEWEFFYTMLSSTGKNISPTLRGVHEIAERGEWFFSERFDSGGENWVQFSGPYLFHSPPMDRHGNIQDYTLLERGSAGCVRLSVEDSAWFYSFIKRGSTVFVN